MLSSYLIQNSVINLTFCFIFTCFLFQVLYYQVDIPVPNPVAF